MSEYYYLTASLPMLNFEEEPTLSIQEFRKICSHLMQGPDLQILQEALLNSGSLIPVSNYILKKYREGEFGLRNELVKLRAKGKGQDPELYLHQEYNNPLFALKAREIFESENPLKAEMIYNRALWDLLDELETGQMFNLEFLIIYYLKLQVLERIKLNNPERGMQKVKNILNGESDNG